MRYFLIVVAVGAAVYLGWLTTDWNPSYGVLLWPPALVLGLAAIGLIMRQAWAAYLLSVGAFISAVPIALLLLWVGPANFRDQPASGFDPGWLVLWGLLLLAVTVGGMGIALGASLRRERRERGAQD